MAQKKAAKAPEPAAAADQIEVRTPNDPSYRGLVEKERYLAMRKVLLAAMPRKAPGLTQSGMLDAVWPAAPRALFPTAGKAMWWLKWVQLDLEARGLVRRLPTSPTQWVRGAGRRSA